MNFVRLYFIEEISEIFLTSILYLKVTNLIMYNTTLFNVLKHTRFILFLNIEVSFTVNKFRTRAKLNSKASNKCLLSSYLSQISNAERDRRRRTEKLARRRNYSREGNIRERR